MFDYIFIDDLQILGGGNGLGVRQFKGPGGSPPPRIVRHAKSQRHGAHDKTRFYEGRTFEVLGDAVGADEAESWEILDDMKATLQLGDEGRTLRWRRTGRDEDEQATVIVASEVDDGVSPDEPGIVRWGFSLFAPDPRVYSSTLKSGSYDPTEAAAGGISFPLMFPLNFFGDTTKSIEIVNAGKSPTPPVYTITGPSRNPRIVNETTGTLVVTSAILVAGEELMIDVAERMVMLTTGGSEVERPDLINPEFTMWGDLRPGTNVVKLIGSDHQVGETLLTVSWRDARI